MRGSSLLDLLGLALRNLLARPTRSLLTLLGVLVATASMVLFLSFGEGLRRALFQELGRVGPGVQVLPEGVEGFAFGAYPELSPDQVAALREVAQDLGAQAIPSVFLLRGGFDLGQSFVFQGLPPGVGPEVLYPGLRPAKGALVPGPKGAVLGARLAERQALELGAPLRLGSEVVLEVEGILAPLGGLADNLVFVQNGVLQRVLGTENHSAVFLRLPPGLTPEEAARRVQERVPGVRAETPGEVMRFAERAIRISDLVRFGISLVALVVGGLLVANTMTMSVYERVREFGVMRALGARQGFVVRLVLLEALFLAGLGGLGGVVLGALASTAINLYTVAQVGLPLSAITPRLVLFSLGVALGLGLLAGWAPARHAGRIPVVEALGRV